MRGRAFPGRWRRSHGFRHRETACARGGRQAGPHLPERTPRVLQHPALVGKHGGVHRRGSPETLGPQRTDLGVQSPRLGIGRLLRHLRCGTLKTLRALR